MRDPHPVLKDYIEARPRLTRLVDDRPWLRRLVDDKDHQDTVGAGLFVALVVTACLFAGCQAPAVTEPQARPQSPAVLVVPDLVGMPIDDARDALSESGIGWSPFSEHDQSYRHREISGPYDWTVTSTYPAAGTPAEPGDMVWMYALHDSEYAWFAEHPTMPRIGHARRAWDLADDGGPLADVEDLIDYRYAPGWAPSYADRGPFTPDPTSDAPVDPSIEPRHERRARASLAQAKEYDRAVGTLLRPGTPLRPGQAIVVLLRADADDLPASSPHHQSPPTTTWVPVPDGDDDDDSNIPGWLCPTRFC